ncbi:MAG: IPTL-CTERM sorting domain-containing protein [Xanthomonadales bacterium]|jgi:hypothetical protein|nr:IPTL-CTERM sorting domain-containing protein [Xanthomonadales bacterium]
MISRKALVGVLCACSFTAPVAAQTIEDLGTSGVQDNGTLQGTATITTDARFGSGAVHLPAGDGNIVALTQPVTDLDMTSSYTYMTWFKQDAAGSKGLIILGNCCEGPTALQQREGYTMTLTLGSEIRYWGGSSVNDWNHNEFTPTTSAINDGNWHHAAIRVQPDRVDMFFDGALVSTGTESNIPTSPSLATANTSHGTFVPKIGGNGISNGSTAVTVIDDVRVYGAALSDQDIVAAMNNTGPLPDRLYYTFDDDSIVESDGTTRILVTKTFADNFPGEVDVTLTCNGGLPLEQTATIQGGDPDGVRFTVTNISDGETDCTVTETAGPDGYLPSYNGAPDNCTFENITSGALSCSITNMPEDGSYTVNMLWDLEGPGAAPLDDVEVRIICDQDNGGVWEEPGIWVVTDYLDAGESATVSVDTSNGEAECWAIQEDLESSGIETFNQCSPDFVSVGEQVSCDITNSLFFEGIPSLDRYGMALMALLMLGVGFVGFRRFV